MQAVAALRVANSHTSYAALAWFERLRTWAGSLLPNTLTPVLIRDLGKLQYGHQVREGILGKDNNPDTVEGIV